MDLLKFAKRLAEALLALSFMYFTSSPIMKLVGIMPPEQVANVADILKFVVSACLIIFAAIVGITIGLGFLILTGWQDCKIIPKPLKLCFAFALGAVALLLSGPLSLLIPVPILPTIITSLLLWGALRGISKLGVSAEFRKKHLLTVQDAIKVATSFINQLEPESEDMNVAEAKIDGDHWMVFLSSQRLRKNYKIKLDGCTGEITEWKTV